MPTQKTRNYLRYVNDGKEEDAIHRVSTRGDRKNDACGGLRLHIPILSTIYVLLGATHSLDCGKIGRD
ncbi:MAG: hypothetical protein V7L01_10280 [Nostoc sp.]|uniref:hypothetical protein n=1 Tax=Nostoc sp. TaxID=1180 RepID=UPI002FFD1E1F